MRDAFFVRKGPATVMLTASELRITVEGIRSTRGTILLGLYDSLETFTRAIKLSDTEGFLSSNLHIFQLD
jgi:uncharacterized protein (DUF2141 family)